MEPDDSISIQPEQPGDYGAIRRVNLEAFGQEVEGKLIEELRKRPEFIRELSFVAKAAEEVVGHLLLFPVRLSNRDWEITALLLGPMAVSPSYQRKGIGSRMVKRAIAGAKAGGYDLMLVVGHPGYFPRFGFRPASHYRIRFPAEVPAEAFMALNMGNESLHCFHWELILPDEYAASL